MGSRGIRYQIVKHHTSLYLNAVFNTKYKIPLILLYLSVWRECVNEVTTSKLYASRLAEKL